MDKFIILFLSLFGSTLPQSMIYAQDNYLDYHKAIVKCETLIVEKDLEQAIQNFNLLFSQYNPVFLRDCQLATQLALFEHDTESGIHFIRLGVEHGWTLKAINKTNNIDWLTKTAKWEMLISDYDSLHQIYLNKLNPDLAKQVNVMLKKDQKKAFGALLRIGQKAQDKYAEQKFAPHSEVQLKKLNQILDEYGYPGEHSIGNDWWTSVILSHHNSISQQYNSQDTLYQSIRPKLLESIYKGQLSPYTFATIEDWKEAALTGHSMTLFGFLGSIPNDSVLIIVNKNRAELGMRSIELRNRLLQIEQETGMNLYLPKDWQKGVIKIYGE